MFTFNLQNLLFGKSSLKEFEPLTNTDYIIPTPGEIRKTIKKLSRCSNCHFLIFDDYWTDEVEKSNVKMCPTCGHKI